MTRFARAKGSKASNERLPEEATSWSEMKQQLENKNKEITEGKKRQAVLNQRDANYKAFLEEKEQDALKKSNWADFPSENSKNNKGVTIKGNKSHFGTNDDESDDETFTALIAKVDKVLTKSENKQRINDDNDDAPEEQSSKVPISEIKNKQQTNNDDAPEEQSSKVPISEIKNKPKKKKLSITINGDSKDNEESIDKNKTTSEENIDSSQKLSKKKLNQQANQGKNIKKRKLNKEATDQPEVKKLKTKKTGNDIAVIEKQNKQGKQKGKIQKKIIPENLTEKDLKKIEKKKQKRIKQMEKKKRVKEELKKQKQEEEEKKIENGETITSPEVKENKINKDNKKPDQGKFEKRNTFEKGNAIKDGKNKFENRVKKERDNKDHKRKKPFMPTKMIINGKEVQVDYVDGFPVKKEDAMRLKKLRKEMISKGLPRSEINISLKLERRKAEKAFAREKKNVCFNCRKSGHNLSECPELDKDQVASHSGSGICYKCGSTEHTHFECKVVRGQEFKFASCFICNEQGHIARQCPDNARGLYPKGGACRVCGDVTHLKKDCPKYQSQQQQIQNSLSVETIGDSNPDVLDEKNQFKISSLGNRKPNKVIKF